MKKNIIIGVVAGAFVIGGALTYFVVATVVPMIQSGQKMVMGHVNDVRSKLNINEEDVVAQADTIYQQMRERFMNSKLIDNQFLDTAAFAIAGTSNIKVNQRDDSEFKYVEVLVDGMDEQSINVNVENGMISIRGEIQKIEENSKVVSSFARSFSVPAGVDENQVKIDMQEDKIVIKFPKAQV